MNNLLEVKDLSIKFKMQDHIVYAVNNLNFNLKKGEILGIVGESGSGKSQTIFSLIGLLAKNAIVSGNAIFAGENLLTLTQKQLNHLRAEKISMIFQDPMTALNPYLKIGEQLSEVLKVHKGMSDKDATNASITMLNAVKIPEASKRMKQYAHELSGGMRQRVMIAMSLLCRPQLLLADEPTTALDVTIQAQILELLKELQQELELSVIFITHDLAVVSEICDSVLVMYAGHSLEYETTENIFNKPLHPYTQGLLKAIPSFTDSTQQLYAIPGAPQQSLVKPTKCVFYDRCEHKFDKCSQKPEYINIGEGHMIACHLFLQNNE